MDTPTSSNLISRALQPRQIIVVILSILAIVVTVGIAWWQGKFEGIAQEDKRITDLVPKGSVIVYEISFISRNGTTQEKGLWEKRYFNPNTKSELAGLEMYMVPGQYPSYSRPFRYEGRSLHEIRYPTDLPKPIDDPYNRTVESAVRSGVRTVCQGSGLTLAPIETDVEKSTLNRKSILIHSNVDAEFVGAYPTGRPKAVSLVVSTVLYGEVTPRGINDQVLLLPLLHFESGNVIIPENNASEVITTLVAQQVGALIWGARTVRYRRH